MALQLGSMDANGMSEAKDQNDKQDEKTSAEDNWLKFVLLSAYPPTICVAIMWENYQRLNRSPFGKEKPIGVLEFFGVSLFCLLTLIMYAHSSYSQEISWLEYSPWVSTFVSIVLACTAIATYTLAGLFHIYTLLPEGVVSKIAPSLFWHGVIGVLGILIINKLIDFFSSRQENEPKSD